MKYEVVIIGSGLGGLECGYILAKNGYGVCILEKNAQIGGCLQTFRRGGAVFDTGFHCIGGLEEGQSLHRLFEYFDLLNLPWLKMDENGFAEIVLNGKSFMFASGHERFVDTLAKDFPRQRKNLEQYAALLKSVGNSLNDAFKPTVLSFAEKAAGGMFGVSAYEFLQNTVDDGLLRNVLSGASLTMELNAETLPLYIFAQINNSFVQSAWRLAGNGSMIADGLAENIRKMGGAIFTKSEVTRLVETDGRIACVEIDGGEQIFADHVISNAHPAATLDLIAESRRIRKTYRNRIAALPNTFGIFTVHLKLKKNSTPYFNRNVFVYADDDVWAAHGRRKAVSHRPASVLLTCRAPMPGESFTENIDILSPMRFDELARWNDTGVGKRGESYEAFKQRRAEDCIALAQTRFPEIGRNIERIYTSSPLTYRDYTGTREGSAYGIRKDCNNLLYTLLTPRTPVPNLLLTGQNINLHGILGVSMTAVLTCAAINPEIIKNLH